MNLEVALDKGFMGSQVVLAGGKKIFKKSINLPNFLLRKIEKKLLFPILKSSPFSYHLTLPNSSNELLEKEVLTWDKWNKEGFPTLNLEEFSGEFLCWEYLSDSISLKNYFNQKDSLEVFDNFIDLYSRIRKKALKSKDSMYFHSDPHLGNFLIDKSEEIIPIDSGHLLNKELSLDELDFHLLKRTLYSISNLETSKEVKKKYIASFNQMLEDKKRDQFLNWDYSVPPLSRRYFGLRDWGLSKMNANSEDLLKNYDSFVSFFNSDIKEIFSK